MKNARHGSCTTVVGTYSVDEALTVLLPVVAEDTSSLPGGDECRLPLQSTSATSTVVVPQLAGKYEAATKVCLPSKGG